MLNKKTIMGLFISFGILVNLQAASFNCKKATSLVEHAVCNDLTLSKLDEQLASIYKQSLKETKDAKELKEKQRDWILYDRDNCDSVDCLKDSYTTQIDYLKTHLKPKDIHKIAGLYKLNKASITIEPDLFFSYFNSVDTGNNFCHMDNVQLIKVGDIFSFKDEEGCTIEIKKINNDSLSLFSSNCETYCGMNVDFKDGVFKKRK